MGMLDKLLGRDVDTFAQELAEMVAKRYPPTLDKAPERRISANRISKVLEDTLSRAADYNRSARLGVYKKARLANTFKWKLKELGYTDRFVEVATEGLVVYVSRKGDSKESESKS